ncbi:hypothetical protein WMY93_031016 [Mugilogobius chulae]|uniref:Uncharacterized protein n=1 Tax=Mugilogobius chulae TaxID=88201 RepID=A0AAW0MJ24_9GOBI
MPDYWARTSTTDTSPDHLHHIHISRPSAPQTHLQITCTTDTSPDHLHHRHISRSSAPQTHLQIICTTDTSPDHLHHRHISRSPAPQTHLQIICTTDTSPDHLHHRHISRPSAPQTHLQIICTTDTSPDHPHRRHISRSSSPQTHLQIICTTDTSPDHLHTDTSPDHLHHRHISRSSPSPQTHLQIITALVLSAPEERFQKDGSNVEQLRKQQCVSLCAALLVEDHVSGSVLKASANGNRESHVYFVTRNTVISDGHPHSTSLPPEQTGPHPNTQTSPGLCVWAAPLPAPAHVTVNQSVFSAYLHE